MTKMENFHDHFCPVGLTKSGASSMTKSGAEKEILTPIGALGGSQSRWGNR